MEKFSEKFMNELLVDFNYDLKKSSISGERIAHRLAKIASIGLTESGGSNRPGFSIEEKEAKDMIKMWMKGLDLIVKEDGAGNIIGRLEGEDDSLPGILLGSHVDTVPNGGHFDGILGIITYLEVLESWKQKNYKPNRTVEIIVFSDEEGSRFHFNYTGSAAMAGDLERKSVLDLFDREGKPIADVLGEMGLSVETLLSARRNLDQYLMYIELHIEQGKELERLDIPVGVVTGISGSYSLEFEFIGRANHAGNTPMNNRSDALLPASEFILKVNDVTKKISETAVGTVGKMDVHPNGSNVIPGSVMLTVDIRDINQTKLDKLYTELIEEAEHIAQQYQVSMKVKMVSKAEALPIHGQTLEKQAKILEKNEIKSHFIPSGAGHDGLIIGKKLPIAMYFIRSKDGISHNPKEWTSLNDILIATNVLKDYLESDDYI